MELDLTDRQMAILALLTNQELEGLKEEVGISQHDPTMQADERREALELLGILEAFGAKPL